MGDDVERIRRAAPKIADRRYRHGGGSLCPETDLAGQAGEIAEAALAHVVGDAAERAYRRGDALEKRRAMMEAWAQWCEPKAGSNVVPFGKAATGAQAS